MKWSYYCKIIHFALSRPSDNGTQFVNKLIEAFTQTAGIEHAAIHAYSHEENGIVERANKEVNRHLRAMTYDMPALQLPHT